MKLRAVVVLLSLLFARAAQADPLVFVEAAGALFLRNDPQGSFADPELGWGARAGVAIDRTLALPEALRFDAGLLWYASAQSRGTRAVRVDRWLHTLALPLRAGWELDWRPFDALLLAPYLTGGPALTLTDVQYRVADPVAIREGGAAVESSASEWKVGGLYGTGLSVRAPGADLGVAGRLELLRLHRGPYADLAIGLGLGAEF